MTHANFQALDRGDHQRRQGSVLRLSRSLWRRRCRVGLRGRRGKEVKVHTQCQWRVVVALGLVLVVLPRVPTALRWSRARTLARNLALLARTRCGRGEQLRVQRMHVHAHVAVLCERLAASRFLARDGLVPLRHMGCERRQEPISFLLGSQEDAHRTCDIGLFCIADGRLHRAHSQSVPFSACFARRCDRRDSELGSVALQFFHSQRTEVELFLVDLAGRRSVAGKGERGAGFCFGKPGTAFFDVERQTLRAEFQVTDDVPGIPWWPVFRTCTSSSSLRLYALGHSGAAGQGYGLYCVCAGCEVCRGSATTYATH